MNHIWLILMMVLVGIPVQAYKIGVSPSKIELVESEYGQLMLFNNNDVAVDYVIESKLLECKKKGKLMPFEHKKVIVKSIEVGKEDVFVSFKFWGVVQELVIEVEVIRKKNWFFGMFSSLGIVLFGLTLYRAVKEVFSKKRK